MEEYNNDRITTGFGVGTIVGTIFTAPINYSAYIFGFKYDSPYNSGTIGTITVAVNTYRLGTLTGTVDTLTLVPGSPNVRDGFGENPVARVEAGDSLTAVITAPSAAGSIIGVVSYRYIPGRTTGP